MKGPAGAGDARDAFAHQHGQGHRGAEFDHGASSPMAIQRRTRGLCIGHVSPEAAEGGPIGLVRDGDKIVIDLTARKLDFEVGNDELARRRKEWKQPAPKYSAAGWPGTPVGDQREQWGGSGVNLVCLAATRQRSAGKRGNPMNWRDRISVDPKVCHARSALRGHGSWFPWCWTTSPRESRSRLFAKLSHAQTGGYSGCAGLRCRIGP